VNAITIRTAIDKYLEMKVISVNKKDSKIVLNINKSELFNLVKELNSYRLIPSEDIKKVFNAVKTFMEHENVMMTKL